MKGSSNQGRDLWIVAALSGLIVALFWLILPSQFNRNESSDFLSFYGPVARNVLDGQGFTLPDGRSAILYPPGFVLYTAGLFAIGRATGLSENTVLMAASLIAMALSATLLYCIANLFWGQKAARITALAWSTYPLALWLTKQPSAEAPFTVLLYGAVLLCCRELARPGRIAIWIGIGALAGLAMLVRPVAVGIPFVFGALLLLTGTGALAKRILLTGCMLSSVLLVIAPWEIWLHRTEGRFILLGTIGGPTMRDGMVFGVHLKGYRERILLPADVEKMMLDLNARRDELTSEKAVLSAVAEYFQKAPLTVAKLFGIKALRSWYATDSRRLDMPLIAIQLIYLATILVASVRAWRWNADCRRAVIIVWGILLYFWAMNTISAAIVRYMVPAIGLLFVSLPVFIAGSRWIRVPERFEINESIVFPQPSRVQ